MGVHTIEELRHFQRMPLPVKVAMTKTRIRSWVDTYGEDGVYVSFSGGKDSTVLLRLVREEYPNVPAVFVDTGLEYPEIREFVKKFDNVTWVRPKLNFKQVIEKYGYPFISKEVSECVQGARKYLTSLLNESTIATEQNRTEQNRTEQNRTGYKYFYDKVCGIGSYSTKNEGGYDNKYRKLRGIGDYSKSQDGKQRGRCESETCNNAWDSDRQSDDSGEYP